MARGFNGSTDFISIGSPAVLFNAAVTVNVWLYPTAFPAAYAGLVGSSNFSNAGYTMYLTSGGGLAYYCEAATGQPNIDPGSITCPLNAWSMGTFTYDGTNGLKTFVNTSNAGTTANSGAGQTTATTMDFGQDPHTAGRFFTGRLADVAIWKVALGSTDITNLFNGLRPNLVQSANLVGWWPLDGYASPEPDGSGNGNNGTLTGTTGALVGPSQLWRISG